METVVDITVPTDRFVLEETLERVPDAEFEVVRLAVHGSECPMPFLWGSTSHPDRLDATLRDDSSTECVNCLSRNDGRDLYSVDWTERATCLIEEFAESGGSVLDVRGTADRWTFQMLFPDRATASETYQTWCDAGIGPSIARVSNFSCRVGDEEGLSAAQHSTIVRAFERGYYTVPRRTTLEELATDFEASHQALSERLRRGHSHLVEQLMSDSATAEDRRP